MGRHQAPGGSPRGRWVQSIEGSMHVGDLRTDRVLQELLDTLAAEHDIVGASVAVFAGGEVIGAATGHANRAAGIEATPDTIFQIGSIRKVYTARSSCSW